MGNPPSRSEIDPRYTWNAASVFPNDGAWREEFDSVGDSLATLDRFRGHLGDSPEALAEWFQTYQRLMRRLSKLFVYASMCHSVNMQDQSASARSSQSTELSSRVNAAVAFAEPELLSLPEDTLQEWLQHPDLGIYTHYFDSLSRRREHVRSAEVEQLLGQIGAPFASARRVHSILSDADLRFGAASGASGETTEITHGTINALMTSPDAALRRSAFERYADVFLTVKETTAACLETGVKQDVFLARARRYSSSLDASMLASNIPVPVFHNLISAFRANIPTWHRYWDLRRRALGAEKLSVCDIKAPLVQSQPHVPYDQAIQWICEGMQPLGAEYVQIMRRGLLEERWVDVYPNQGKRMGAFSGGSADTFPFIMMSYTDDLLGLSTLAHELGHSMHSCYTRRTQPLIYSHYGLFVAEVASNFNQALVRSHLFAAQTDPAFQIALIEEAMANFHRYFFIMPTLARFELEIHTLVERGEALTAQGLMTLMADLFREAYGLAVDVDEARVGITWAQFSTHLYSNFYVYQYATGISGAHALAQQVLTGGPEAADRYLDFLKAGGSHYPLDALKMAGVDLESALPVEQTFAVLSSYVDRLAELLNL